MQLKLCKIRVKYQSNITNVTEERFYDEKLSLRNPVIEAEDGSNNYLTEGYVNGMPVYFFYIRDGSGNLYRRHISLDVAKKELLEGDERPFIRTYYSLEITTNENVEPPEVSEEMLEYPQVYQVLYLPKPE